MKHSLSKLFPLLYFALLLLTAGCTKNVPGPKGEAGAPGQNGNLVQKNIDAFVIPSSQWVFDGSIWTTKIYVAEITSEVIKNGETNVYIKDSGEWRRLPRATGNIFTQMKIENSFLHLERSQIHDGPPKRPDPETIRIVIFTAAL